MARQYTVGPDEYLAQVARRYGFADEQALLDHPDNAELKRRRPDPNLLREGDRVVIPERTAKTKEVSTNQVHSFRVKRPKSRLRLALRAGEQVLAKEPYTLRVAHLRLTGSTDDQGRLDVPVPLHATRAWLSLDDKPWLKWTLDLGRLDPCHDPVDDAPVPSGIAARLRNLGFLDQEGDSEALTAAVAQFQRIAIGRAQATGELDSETRRRLLELHGC